MTLAEQLAGSPLFKGVPLADREALIQAMERHTFPAGTVLFHKGDPGDCMYLILAGRVRIFSQDAQGNEFTLRYLTETFGEFSMLDSLPRSASAAADGDLDVLVLHRDAFRAFLVERPLVGLSMMRNLVERVRYTTIYLQRVMDAARQLLDGHYERAAQTIPESPADAEMRGLIQAFAGMVQGVLARQQSLSHPSQRDEKLQEEE